MLSAGIENGMTYSYLLSVDNGDYVLSDTITKIFGSEVVIFSDEGEDMENWTSNKWNITTEHAVSMPYSITDSPGGDYQNSQTNIIEMDTTINLVDVEMAFLRFWAKWDIEEGYDYNQLFISNNNGLSWIALDGKYTKPGSQYQDPGKPVYDGAMDWAQEEIDLSDFAGETIKFRFKMRSDQYLTGDGFYFDDFTVSIISQITSIKNLSEESIFMSDAFPNPAHSQIKVQYSLQQNNHASLEFYNAVGSKLKTVQVSDLTGVLTIPVGDFKSGVYYYRLVNGQQVSNTSKFIKY
jgi:bacillopeptidase F (M6 metalloprotease family)